MDTGSHIQSQQLQFNVHHSVKVRYREIIESFANRLLLQEGTRHIKVLRRTQVGRMPVPWTGGIRNIQ